MKQYQPKFSECPYNSSNGNLCFHKSMGKYCGHKQPKNCPYYNEVVELRKMQDRASKGLPQLSDKHSEVDDD